MSNSYKDSTDAYKQGGGSSGNFVQSVSSGVGVSVDNADPQNPIVSANLTAGRGIQLNEVPESEAIEIECTLGGNDLTGQVVHGVMKAADPLDPFKVSFAGIDQLVETSGNVSAGYGAKVIKCIGGTGGTVDLENCRIGMNADYAAAQGVPFLLGINMIVVNDGTAAFTIMDSSGTIGGAASLVLIPGESVFLWTDSETNWDYRIVTRIRLLTAGQGITLGGTASAPEISAAAYPSDGMAETMSLNVLNTKNILPGGVFLTSVFPMKSFRASKLACYVTNSTALNCPTWILVYDTNGNLLARTDEFQPNTNGLHEYAIEYGPDETEIEWLDMNCGEMYYFAIQQKLPASVNYAGFEYPQIIAAPYLSCVDETFYASPQDLINNVTNSNLHLFVRARS